MPVIRNKTTGAIVYDGPASGMSGQDLSDCILRINTNLPEWSGLSLGGSNLSGAVLSGSTLTSVSFGGVSLTYADFTNSVISACSFMGVSGINYANFSNATFNGTVPFTLSGSSDPVEGLIFRKITAGGATLEFYNSFSLVNADWRGAQVGTINLYGAGITNSDFTGAWISTISNATMNPADASINGTLSQVKISSANYCLFSGSINQGDIGSLTNSGLGGVTFNNCKIGSLSGSSLGGNTFKECRISSGALTGDLSGITFRGMLLKSNENFLSNVTNFYGGLFEDCTLIETNPGSTWDTINWAGKNFYGSTFRRCTFKGNAFDGVGIFGSLTYEDCSFSQSLFTGINVPAGQVITFLQNTGDVPVGKEYSLESAVVQSGSLQISPSWVSGPFTRCVDVKFLEPYHLVGASAPVALAGALNQNLLMANNSFAGTSIQYRTIDNSNLDNTDFTLFTGGNFTIRNSSLRYADFSGLTASSFTIENCDLSGADFTGATLSYCSFRGCNFTGADLTNATFEEVNLSRTQMNGVTTTGLTLTNCNTSQRITTGSSTLDLPEPSTLTVWAALGTPISINNAWGYAGESIKVTLTKGTLYVFSLEGASGGDALYLAPLRLIQQNPQSYLGSVSPIQYIQKSTYDEVSAQVLQVYAHVTGVYYLHANTQNAGSYTLSASW